MQNNKKNNDDIDPELASAIQQVSQDFSKKLNFNVDKDAQQALKALLNQSQNQPKEQKKESGIVIDPFQELQGPDGIQKLQTMFGSQEFQKANQQMMDFFAEATKNMPKDGDPTSSMGMGGMPTGQMFSPEMLQAMLGGGMVPNPQSQLGKHPPPQPNANQSNPFMQSYMDMQNQAMNQMPMFAEGMQSMLENMGDVKNPEEFMMKFMGEFQGFMKSNENNPNVQNFMENLMQDMMNKETLYPHMKELKMELPPWLEKNQSKLSIEDLEKHNQQLDVIEKLVALFENDFAPIDKFNEVDAAVFQKFQQENVKVHEQMKKSGASDEEIKAAIDKRQLPKLDEKEMEERKKIADPIMQNLMKLLQQLQDAGELPQEIIEKVSIKRMNQQMKMFQDMVGKDKQPEM